MIWEKQIMTTLQKIQAALDEVTSVLANDFHHWTG
jgi:hypothetical protein